MVFFPSISFSFTSLFLTCISFHSHYILSLSFFVFCYWVFGIYFPVPIFFCIFALCFFSSICHSKFFYKLPFSHYRIFVLQARKQECPFSSSSSYPVVLLSLSHFTDFYFCLFHLSHYRILHQDIVFSWLKNPFPLHPQSSKCLLLCLPTMHHKNVCKLYASAIYT